MTETQSRRDILVEVAATAVEELAFTSVERVAPDQQVAIEGTTWWSRIEAESRAVAWVGVVIDERLVRLVASMAVGTDPDAVDEAALRDTTAELANTIGGALLRALAENDTFSLGLPVSGVGTPSVTGTNVVRGQLDADGLRMDVFADWRD